VIRILLGILALSPTVLIAVGVGMLVAPDVVTESCSSISSHTDAVGFIIVGVIFSLISGFFSAMVNDLSKPW
jgi:hypothetical protein